jgi:CRISPR/Cas system-associated protein Cas10 (large subunit of type III CRISPR-Cas system)
MLFLMNDVVLSFDPAELTPPVTRDRFAKLSLAYVGELGKELFSEEPLLHRKDPERAERLAALIVSKAPEINAALFIAPGRGCRVADVQLRYVQLGVEVMATLLERQNSGALTNVEADRQVWRRLAA